MLRSTRAEPVEDVERRPLAAVLIAARVWPLLLLLLRFDARRFGAADYDETKDGGRPSRVCAG